MAKVHKSQCRAGASPSQPIPGLPHIPVSPACSSAACQPGLLLATTRAAMGYYEKTKTVITESWRDCLPGAQTGSCCTSAVICFSL